MTRLLRGLGLAWAIVAASAGCNPAERAAKPIVEKNAAARGGLDAWRAVKTLAMSGKLEAGVPKPPLKLAMAYRQTASQRKEARRAHPKEQPPEEAHALQLPFAMELKRPRLSRLEIGFQGQTAVQVFDGTHGWKLRPFIGRREVEPYSAEEMRLASEQSELDGPLLGYADRGGKVELVGTELVEGREAYKIKVTGVRGEVRNVWVDAQTYLDVKVDGTRRLDGKPRPVWTYFRDYRTVGGVQIPYVLETVVEGVVGSEKIMIERVTLNPELADARFQKPDAASDPLSLVGGAGVHP